MKRYRIITIWSDSLLAWLLLRIFVALLLIGLGVELALRFRL